MVGWVSLVGGGLGIRGGWGWWRSRVRSGQRSKCDISPTWGELMLGVGPLMGGGGSLCHMLILRQNNIALSNFRNSYVTQSNLRNGHVTLSNLRNCHVRCHYLKKLHIACH